MPRNRIWVGGLPLDVRESEIEDLFYKYGRIRDISIRTRKTPAFAYVEFEDPRDAEDAVYGRDGYDFGGYRLKVELAKEDRRGYGPPGGYGGPPGRNNFPPSRKTRYRVIVENLPDTASWQDLKDHMRDGGDVTYVDVFKDRQGTYGLVDYSSFEDMDRAIRRLDDTKFKNPYDSTYIRVREYRSPSEERAERRRSRSRGAGRSRSPEDRGRSPEAPRPRSRSRSRSPRDRSVSPRDRSRSRSPPPRSASPRDRSRSRSPRPRSASPRGASRSPARSPPRDRSPTPRGGSEPRD